MAIHYLDVTPLDTAVTSLLDMLDSRCKPLETEMAPVADCCGRILARAVYAADSAPHYYASAMDGVAMRASDGFGATETTPVALWDFEAVDTGDPIPPQYDCVVMVEDLLSDGEGPPRIVSPPVPWQYIRQIGEDICRGEMVFPAKTRLNAAAAGALAASGVMAVEVVRRPLFGMIPTGDEIVPPSAGLQPGEIPEFNSMIFSGMLSEYGAQSKTYPIVPDDFESICAATRQAVAECDAVILIAGSSKGRVDLSRDVIAALGTILLHGVAIRPGKPVILGEVEGRLIVGAPGYPVSGITVLREIIRPAIERWTGCRLPQPSVIEAALGRKILSPLQSAEFVRCRVARMRDGYVAQPLGAGASSIVGFARADGFIRVAQNTEMLSAGEKVAVELTRDLSEIDRTVSVVGSHDPLFDELADILALSGAGIGLASSHVGSMGAITAIGQELAHAGGIHLLDAESGQYNIAYLRRHFPNGGVRLLRGVGRTQGIMTAKGNPHQIRSVADLQGGLRYVNRQRGAGTRILLDYLLNQAGIAPECIAGYTREEMTHFAVAIQIAEGGADAGLGIFAAAQAYGLDFVPIYTEEYDLLVAEDFFRDWRFERFAEALRSPQLRARLEALGGYTFAGIGEEIHWQI